MRYAGATPGQYDRANQEGVTNGSAPGTAPPRRTARKRPTRGTRWRLSLLVAGAALLATGCSDQIDDLLGLLGEDPVGEVAEDPQPPDAQTAADITTLDCEEAAYPCTWDEVDDALLVTSAQLAERLGEIADDSWDPEALAAEIEAQDDVADAAIGVTSLWFRLEGARPVWVFSDAVDAPDDDASAHVESTSDAEAAGPTPTPAGPTPTPASVTSTAMDRATSTSLRPETQPGVLTPEAEPGPLKPSLTAVVGDDPAAKSALVLNLYGSQGRFRSTYDVAALLEETRGYEGNVEMLVNEERGDRTIRPEHFTGWEDYDVVYVATHGDQICDDGHCWTALSLGDTIHEVPADRSEDDLLQLYQYADTPGVTIAWGSGGQVMPVMQGDWLAAHYAGGLQDTLVYITACSSAKTGDLSAGLSGESSVFLGWSDTAWSSHAAAAAIRFFEEASQRGVPSTVAYDEVVADGLHLSEIATTLPGRRGPGEVIYRMEDGELQEVEPDDRVLEIDAELLHHAPGTDLRIREVIELQDPESGEMLTGGEMIPLGSDADGHLLPVRIEVDGVLDGEAGDFEVELIVNGVTVAEGWRLDAEGELVDDETWRIEDEVGLPIGMDDTIELTLDARVTLPEGGISQHVVTINSMGYELHLEAEMDTTAGAMTDIARVEGSFPLSYDADTDEWSGQAPADWLTYTYANSICPEGARELSTSSDVEVARARIDPETGAIELDLRWREDRGGPSVSCGEGGSMTTLSEHEVAVTSLVLALGGNPMSADPGGLPDRLLEFVGPDTVRFGSNQPGGGFAGGDVPGSFVFEEQRVIAGEGGSTTATFRMELTRPDPN